MTEQIFYRHSCSVERSIIDRNGAVFFRREVERSRVILVSAMKDVAHEMNLAVDDLFEVQTLIEPNTYSGAQASWTIIVCLDLEPEQQKQILDAVRERIAAAHD